jgi:hypothetical protein
MMKNMSLGERTRKRLEVQVITPELSKADKKEVKKSLVKLINKCDDLISSAQNLYGEVSNKDLSDAIVILHSAKKSLDNISQN